MVEIGFIQGRLSPLVDGKIQAFPWDDWTGEFPMAEELGIGLMEWTLDQERLRENPLLTETGRERIEELSRRHGVAILTLTGDCFMQAPFYKAQDQDDRASLLEDAAAVIEACGRLGVKIIVFPLVDNGSLTEASHEKDLSLGLEQLKPRLLEQTVRIAFESDFEPERLAAWIASLDPVCFGINYDIGNSAALGFDYRRELQAYGDRIINVHVKDRLRGGGTVPLGSGDADLPGCLKKLKEIGYQGPYILQTARAWNEDHAGVLSRYRDLVQSLLENG